MPGAPRIARQVRRRRVNEDADDRMGRHGIRANSAVPGITDTPDVRRAIQVEQTDKVLVDRAPLGRIVSPDDMGQVAA